MEFIAHRGNNNHDYLENSSLAFMKCFSTSYISGVEMDVRLTLDDVLVVHHDNIKDSKLIDHNNFNEFDNLESLDYILSKLSNKKKIIIDIKVNNICIVDLLYNVLSKYDYDFYICSFSYSIASLFKKKYPSYKVGLIVGYFMNISNNNKYFDFLVVHYTLINRFKNPQFTWTVNDIFIYSLIKDKSSFVITDKSYLLKDH